MSGHVYLISFEATILSSKTGEPVNVTVYGTWSKPEPSLDLPGWLGDIEVIDSGGVEVDPGDYYLRDVRGETLIQELASEYMMNREGGEP